MKHVFISYSHKDSELIDIFRSAFNKYQIDIWIDNNNIVGGTQWKTSIIEGIRSAHVFIACLSKHYFENSQSFIADELELAFQELKKKSEDQSWFIPVKLGNYDSSRVPPQFSKRLAALHTIDLTKGGLEGLTELLNILLPIIKPDIHWFHVLQRRLTDHAESQIKHFTATGTPRFTQIEDGWRSLSVDSIVRPLSSIFIQTQEKAKFSKQPQTEQLLLKDKVVFFTYIPYLDPERFKKSLRTGGQDLPDPYLQFILDNARSLRRMPHWKAMDIVHLLHFDDGNDWVFDIMYLINLELAMAVTGYLVAVHEEANGKNGHAVINYEELYPTYITNAIEHSRFMNILRREEVNAGYAR